MNLLSDFIKNAKNYGIHMDISHFENILLNVYYMDNQGKMVDCNELEAKTFGFTKPEELFGLTPFDFTNESIAVCYQHNNQEIIKKKQPKIVIEPVLLPNNNKIDFLSYKVPFHNRFKKNIGIIGISIPINHPWLSASDFSKAPNVSSDKKPLLTNRQAECLYYFSRGMSIKEIAKTLILSPRTIEHRLEAIKIKLNCTTRYQLMTKAQQIL